ncbi:Syntaxin-18 [Chytriomyces hyalinus]|nr:Syntaxin-18 [Chytriomyces hyalinus]
MDITHAFRNLVAAHASSATTTPPARNKSADLFLAEANAMAKQISTLSSLLSYIAPAYLDSRRFARTEAAEPALDPRMDYSLFGIEPTDFASMSDTKRDHLNARVSLYLETSLQRIKVLEQAISTPSKNSEPSKKDALGSFFASLGVPNESTSSTRHQKMLSEHRSAVIWVLQRRLMTASTAFKELQERRLEIQSRRDEGYLNLINKKPKSRSPSPNKRTNETAAIASASHLLTGITSGLSATVNRAAKMATTMASSQLESIVGASNCANVRDDENEIEGWEGMEEDEFEQPPAAVKSGNSDSGKFNAPEKEDGGGLRHRGGAGKVDGKLGNASNNMFLNPEEEDEAEQFMAGLTGEQRMLLEHENELLLEQFEGGLDQIRNAAQSIQAISNLQNQMAQHLQIQEKQIETLQEEAWQATDDVKGATVYLGNAKRLFAESRVWLLAFFVIASLCLLFLDWFYG